MRWKGRAGSSNVQDRRGGGGGRLVAGGGIGTLVLVVVAMFLGVDPTFLLQQTGSQSERSSQPPANDELSQFVSVVLKDTEDVWHTLFPQHYGQRYQEPTLVLFSGAVQSSCGFAQAAMGPFYCPLDYKVYIDLSFYRELREQLNAPGDFAQAYVIAHEVGHHVQNLLGISGKVYELRQKMPKEEANALSVRQELQADCFAGVWANRAQDAKQILEPGDVDEALGAASAVGDDRLQQQSQGYVVPESFTHGSAEQRASWFMQGFKSGSPEACDTFGSAT